MRWVEDTRSWRNPVAIAMAHAVLVLLTWHPNHVVSTAVPPCRSRGGVEAAPHPCACASMVEAPDREELDEEFDTISSARPPEVVRGRYDRAKMVGTQLQYMLGDIAMHAERLQAPVSWRSCPPDADDDNTVSLNLVTLS